MSSTVNRYSNEFKKQIVELFMSGQSISKLSTELTPVITKNGKSVTPTEIKALENRIRELEMENENLKKRPPYSLENPKGKSQLYQIMQAYLSH